MKRQKLSFEDEPILVEKKQKVKIRTEGTLDSTVRTLDSRTLDSTLRTLDSTTGTLDRLDSTTGTLDSTVTTGTKAIKVATGTTPDNPPQKKVLQYDLYTGSKHRNEVRLTPNDTISDFLAKVIKQWPALLCQPKDLLFVHNDCIYPHYKKVDQFDKSLVVERVFYDKNKHKLPLLNWKEYQK
jgi:hypothetical protein